MNLLVSINYATWRNKSGSRLLHLVTVVRMLLVRQQQAVFMCLFLQCSRAPEWLLIPQLLQHSSVSSPQPQLFTGPRSNKSACIVSPRHFRGCLYILIASIYNSEHPSPGLACGGLLWWLWHKVQWYLFSSMTRMLSAVPGDCSVPQFHLANQDVFGQQCRETRIFFFDFVVVVVA